MHSTGDYFHLTILLAEVIIFIARHMVETSTIDYYFTSHLIVLLAAEKVSYAARDPNTALKKYIIENNLASESEL